MKTIHKKNREKYFVKTFDEFYFQKMKAASYLNVRYIFQKKADAIIGGAE